MHDAASIAYANPAFWRVYNQMHAHDASDLAPLLKILCPLLSVHKGTLSVLIVGVGTGTVELPLLAGMQSLLPEKSITVDCIDRSDVALGILGSRLRTPDWGLTADATKQCEVFIPQTEEFHQARSRDITFNLLKLDVDRASADPARPEYDFPSSWAFHETIKDKSYDLVIAAFSLLHIHFWNPVLRQILAHLVKDGIFIHPKALGDEVIWESACRRNKYKTRAERVFLDVVYREEDAREFARQNKGITAGNPDSINVFLDSMVAAGYLRMIECCPFYTYSRMPIPATAYPGLLATRGFGLFRKLESVIGVAAYDSIVDESSRLIKRIGGSDRLNLEIHWDIYQLSVDPRMAHFLTIQRKSETICAHCFARV
ncbi:MAG: hypothetical protein WCK77_20565 [Verrucomicrobiota bacterium]